MRYSYECDQCGHTFARERGMDEWKSWEMCPMCWGQAERLFSTGVTAHVFKEYQVDVPTGERVSVTTARQDRDIPKIYGICKATSDEIGCTKKKGIKLPSFAEDYARHARISI